MSAPKAPLPDMATYRPPAPTFTHCPRCGVLALRDAQTQALVSCALGMPHTCPPPAPGGVRAPGTVYGGD